MMRLHLVRGSLAICAAAAMLSGCGSQIQPPAPGAFLTQNATHRPDTPMPCAVKGKKYTTGTARGHVSLVAGKEDVPVGPTINVRFTLTYSDWPIDRSIVRYVPKLITCGLASGKAPLGEVLKAQSSNFNSRCSGGVCEYVYVYEESYKPPEKLARKKPWRYDFIRWVPEKPRQGYGPLPHFTIQLNP